MISVAQLSSDLGLSSRLVARLGVGPQTVSSLAVVKKLANFTKKWGSLQKYEL
jgi:hypothetical protein